MNETPSRETPVNAVHPLKELSETVVSFGKEISLASDRQFLNARAPRNVQSEKSMGVSRFVQPANASAAIETGFSVASIVVNPVQSVNAF
jgi:hypothetical protein